VNSMPTRGRASRADELRRGRLRRKAAFDKLAAHIDDLEKQLAATCKRLSTFPRRLVFHADPAQSVERTCGKHLGTDHHSKVIIEKAVRQGLASARR